VRDLYYYRPVNIRGAISDKLMCGFRQLKFRVVQFRNRYCICGGHTDRKMQHAAR